MLTHLAMVAHGAGVGLEDLAAVHDQRERHRATHEGGLHVARLDAEVVHVPCEAQPVSSQQRIRRNDSHGHALQAACNVTRVIAVTITPEPQRERTVEFALRMPNVPSGTPSSVNVTFTRCGGSGLNSLEVRNTTVPKAAYR
jgi:hypothetical protein